jgi:hypothetical protein
MNQCHDVFSTFLPQELIGHIFGNITYHEFCYFRSLCRKYYNDKTLLDLWRSNREQIKADNKFEPSISTTINIIEGSLDTDKVWIPKIAVELVRITSPNYACVDKVPYGYHDKSYNCIRPIGPVGPIGSIGSVGSVGSIGTIGHIGDIGHIGPMGYMGSKGRIIAKIDDTRPRCIIKNIALELIFTCGNALDKNIVNKFVDDMLTTPSSNGEKWKIFEINQSKQHNNITAIINMLCIDIEKNAEIIMSLSKYLKSKY